MKLKFKQQQYQTDATMSVVNCFEGQKKGSRRDLIARYTKTTDKGTLLEKTYEEEIISFGNQNIILSETERKNNIRKVQRLNDISYTEGNNLTDFTIEMETGTGKTYTYIKTMYELNEHYGWSKFIVMVPSIAIREGVQKSFEITQDHFQEFYKKKIRYFVYNSNNSSNIANINTFASDSSIQVMIINYQAFNSKVNSSKAGRRIFEELDELQSRRPIDVIKSVRPILIIDEPQKIGDKTEGLLDEFKPLFTLRYSATHKKGKEYNKIYRLDAVDAYNQKLVKKINVKGIELLHNKSEDTYLYLDSVDISKKHAPVARMEIEQKTTTGVRRVTKLLSAGMDLFQLSGGLSEYKNYVVSEIDGRYDSYDKVFFTNGVEIQVGQAFGDVDDEYITRIQIRETIRSHFEKEKELHKLGIKVLSLFFIDEVAKYKYYEDGTAYKGLYAKMFEEEYNNILNEYRTITDEDYTKYIDSFNTGKIHAGYFSIDKKGHEVDPTINDKKEMLSFDEDAYELIMKDKERLLSLDEPVRFIFSHSALREGWDNPNIFQICTLKRSNSEISKRQEIGRGLRICVNNNGDRMDYSVLEGMFHNINTLTVVASESYEKFADALQSELADSLSERPKNFTYESFTGKVLINDDTGEKYEFTSEHFQDFLIFNVMNGYVDKDNNYMITDKFVEDMENDKLEVMPALIGFEKEISSLMKRLYSTNTKLVNNENRMNIKDLVPNDNFKKKEFQDLWNKINIKSVYEVSFNTDELIKKCINSINENLIITKMKVRITSGEQKETISSVSLNDKTTMTDVKTTTDVVEDFTPSNVKYDLVGQIASDTGLTRSTIIKILTSINSELFNKFKYNPEEFIRKVSTLINSEKATTIIDGITYHKTDQKYDNDIFTINNIKAELNENAIEVKKNIYNYLVTDSKNERKFAKDLEAGEVSVYAKLPSGFKIPTPVGNYNPDWAIVFENKTFKHIYFIAETKGSMDSLELRDVEKAKIACAKKHFESITDGNIKYDMVNSYEELINIVTA
ncbi:MAG TPA: DEAD/DEAH box helicase family protein [Bacilli bacterium]|nr:DEAD/DEAH box helicase family protein [Bacilli bacterium]